MAWTLISGGRGVIASEVTANAFSKTLTLADLQNAGSASPSYEITQIRVEYAADASGINPREPVVELQKVEDDDVIVACESTTTVANGGSQNYSWYVNAFSAAGSLQKTERMPDGMIISNGTKLVVRDNSGENIALDDITVHVNLKRV